MQNGLIYRTAVAILLLLVSSESHASIVVGGSTLLTQADADQLEAWLGEGTIQLTRIFAKQPGDDSFDFHAAVDGKGRTFSVMQVLANSATDFLSGAVNNPAQVVGGYNPQSWSSIGNYIETPADSDRGAFLFNLTTMEIQRQNLIGQGDIDSGRYQTFPNGFYGPTFGTGHDIYVAQDLASGSFVNFSYGGISGTNTILSGTSFGQYNQSASMFGALEVFTIAAAEVNPAVPELSSVVIWGCFIAFGAICCRRN